MIVGNETLEVKSNFYDPEFEIRGQNCRCSINLLAGYKTNNNLVHYTVKHLMIKGSLSHETRSQQESIQEVLKWLLEVEYCMFLVYVWFVLIIPFYFFTNCPFLLLYLKVLEWFIYPLFFWANLNISILIIFTFRRSHNTNIIRH